MKSLPLARLLFLLPLAAPPGAAQSYHANAFETDPVGSKPAGDYTFSPSANTATNGFEIIDATSTPANPLGTHSLYLFDRSGDAPTHWRGPFAEGIDVSNLRVDFDFRRGFQALDANDSDTRFHFAVGRAGNSLNNSDFRPFEIRLLNHGGLVVNSIDGSSSVGTHLTELKNHLTVMANSHDTSAVAWTDPTLGSGSLEPNTFKVFLNNADLGTFTFHQTPDPANAPQVDFYAQNDDLGQFAFYQDTSRPGELVIDNLSITSLTEVPTAIAAPTALSVSAPGPSQVDLSWNDNSDNELSFVIERHAGSGAFLAVAEVAADVTSFSDTTVMHNTAYTYQVRARAGVVSSEPTNAVMVSTPEQIAPLITELDAPPRTVATGETAEVTVTAIGRAPLAYQWYHGLSGNASSPIDGATAATLTLPNLTTGISVWVRVRNGAGTDDSETTMIAVREPGSVVVADQAELEEALASTGPGDIVLLANGTWDDAVIRLTGVGTASSPITVGAETPGQVILTGDSRAQIGGQYTVLRDLVFTGAYTGNDDEVIQFRNGSSDPAHFARVTNVTIIDYVPADGADTDWVSFYGSNNRLDNSYLSGHDVAGVTVVIDVAGEIDNHRIDHNHFADRIFGEENGWETIRIGVSGTSLQDSATIVEHNLFTRLDGEIEIISNKAGGNIYRHNTFLDCSGTLTLRHGNGCRVEANLFLGRGRAGSGGVRIIGEDHVVVNNHFENLAGRDGAAITVYAGVDDGPLNEYFAAHRALIAFNTFVDNDGPAIHVGTGFGSRDRTILPQDVRVAHNVMARTGSSSRDFLGGAATDNVTWTSNLHHNGALGLAEPAGFIAADPGLAWDPLRLFHLPASDGAVAGQATAELADVTTDLEGRGRSAPFDLGAVQVSALDSPVVIEPASMANTGPAYLSANRNPATPKADLVNSSVRALSDSGDAILINGFVVGGQDLKSILVRTVGPGLTSFGVTEGFMPAPSVKVLDASSSLVAENAGWENGDVAAIMAASALVGAFPLQTGVADSAVITTVSPGAYTAQVAPVDGTGGNVLVEVYDVTPGSGYLLNQSSRGEIREGQEVLIAGFAVKGTVPRRALIRGVGPTLANHGTPAPVSDPQIKLFNAAQVEILANDDWSDQSAAADIAAATTMVGAFPLPEGSADAAVLIELAPGSFTVHARGVNGALGTVLIEVYFLDE